MSKRVLISGIAGQDGSYLSEHLLEKGYEVHGIVRRDSISENQDRRLNGLNVNLHYGDMLDVHSLQRIFNEVAPDEIYNLAAQSHVRVSFDVPSFTIQTNGLGVLNILEAYKNTCPDARFYQASSSEMFGNSIDDDDVQRITTPMHPVSPYGCAKVLGFNLVRHYRVAYGLHACNGVLFNHESPRRASNFVTGKVVNGAIQIYYGEREKLYLGNLDSSRDWGHSWDYVRAMKLIVDYGVPSDWVVATGESKSVRDLCEYVFSKFDLNYSDYVVSDDKYKRPEELNYLRGDSKPIREILNWSPKYTFETLLDEMVRVKVKAREFGFRR